jgi:hypothetical protein
MDDELGSITTSESDWDTQFNLVAEVRRGLDEHEQRLVLAYCSGRDQALFLEAVQHVRDWLAAVKDPERLIGPL